jgi:hypothetical protein
MSGSAFVIVVGFSFAPSSPTLALTHTPPRPRSPTAPGPHTSTPTLHPPKPPHPHHIPTHPNTCPTQTAPPTTPRPPLLCSRCRPPLWLVPPPALPRPLLSPLPHTARSAEPLPLWPSPHPPIPSPPRPSLLIRQVGGRYHRRVLGPGSASRALPRHSPMRAHMGWDGRGWLQMGTSGHGWKREETDGGGQ